VIRDGEGSDDGERGGGKAEALDWNSEHFYGEL